MIVLHLPYPPTLNHMYGVQRSGRRFIKASGVLFKKEVAEIVAEQNIMTLNGQVCVFITAHMPDKRRRDLMNLEKITSDALTDAGVWLDDFQIDSFQIARGAMLKGGKLVVVITEIEAQK